MSESKEKRNPGNDVSTDASKGAPKDALKDAPKGESKDGPKDGPNDGPVPQDDADECETNDGMPSGGKRKPKCHEGYPEQQPTDTDAG